MLGAAWDFSVGGLVGYAFCSVMIRSYRIQSAIMNSQLILQITPCLP